MSGQNINVTKTDPVILNTLPLIFDKKFNAAIFKYEFGVPSDKTEHPMLLIELEYLSYDINNEIIGTLKSTTTFTIKSVHRSFDYLKIFYEMFGLDVSSCTPD